MVVTRGPRAAAPRAAGVRLRYVDVPAHVHAWVESELGSRVVSATDQVGGMSPGCATRLVTADGQRAFVKAVGPELNPVTPTMVRDEARVLGHLGSGPLWADLLAVLDVPDGWVALLLEDVPGRHPDVSHPDDVHRVLSGADALTDALRQRGAPRDLPPVGPVLSRWGDLWNLLDGLPPGLLPDWLREHAGPLAAGHTALVERSSGGQVAHFDLRNDNMLVRDDGSLVFVDWGGARRAAAWLDPLIARLEWVEQPVFDRMCRDSAALAALGDDLVTTFLATFGGWLAYRNTVAEDIGLPTLRAFRAAESARFLAGARRRLGVA